MLNTKKLLYILPDVVYVAELLPTKKEHTFSIQTFRQINGEFLNDEEFIAENIEKLFSKIEPEEYYLILPDFLFTNTILEVKETQESKVKQHIKEVLLPSLGLTKETHAIETLVLTQLQNVTKIQLAALEKSVLNPVIVSAKEHNVHITHISPLSWTIKSIVSLEPSISVIQIGSLLYVAEHYIGVDQCTMAKVEEVENVADTIKTLKGAQPSTQTIYLLTNALVEEKLKELVSSTLPIQQLATFKEEDTQMPSYVKQIIESGMKTLDIPDFTVPTFDLPKTPSVPMMTTNTTAVAEEEKGETALPKPQPLKVDHSEPETASPVEEEKPESSEEVTEVETPKQPEIKTLDVAPVVAAAPVITETEPDLSQFANGGTTQPSLPETEPTSSTKVVTESLDEPKTVSPEPLTAEPVLKNPATQTSNNMIKKIFMFIAILGLMMAIGAGLGLGVLTLFNRNSDTNTTSPLATATPVPSPVIASPSPSPVSTIKKAETAVLVVNATTTPGYAGGTKTKLEKDGFKPVKAGNAKGTYTPGTYVLMKTRDEALLAELEKSSGLTLEFADGYATEDPTGANAAVIVLAK